MTRLAQRSVLLHKHSLDFDALWREYPPPPDYVDLVNYMPRDALRELQERRFLQQMNQAWKVPFYERHWSAAGMEPGDIRCLDDLQKIPTCNADDIRDGIAHTPPWDDFIGIDFDTDEPQPLIVQPDDGTTPSPRPMFYTPRDREVMNIMLARRLHMQGVRPFDLLQITLSLGPMNAGLSVRESIWKYSGAIPVPAGHGNNTPTRRQLEIIQHWGIHFVLGSSSYLQHMATTARDELHLDPRAFGLKGLLVHLGADQRNTLEDLWGVPAFDSYSVREVGTVAADCEHRSGMHIFEDAHIVELLDPHAGVPVPTGEQGSVVITSLFQHLVPMIRYDTRDVSTFVPGSCRCGSTHARLEKIFGRAE